jgi:hypothetical protein
MTQPPQRFNQRGSQKSRGARNQNAHSPGLPLPASTLRPERWKRQMNFGNVSFLFVGRFEWIEISESP